MQELLCKIATLWDIMKKYPIRELANTLSYLSRTEALAGHRGDGLVPSERRDKYHRPHVEEARRQCVLIELSGAIHRCDTFLRALHNRQLTWFELRTQATVLREAIEADLSDQVFLKVNAGRRKFYDAPFEKWEEIIKRFGKITRDVEEMNMCFALSRYTGAMFHAMQIAELGAIELGDYIGVTDPKKGWGATQKKLNDIVMQGHSKLPANLTGKYEFLEQMNREIDSLVLAWRHKLDHAANRLAILPNTDFTPDVAEHIIGAVRIFMLRLQEGMP